MSTGRSSKQLQLQNGSQRATFFVEDCHCPALEPSYTQQQQHQQSKFNVECTFVTDAAVANTNSPLDSSEPAAAATGADYDDDDDDDVSALASTSGASAAASKTRGVSSSSKQQIKVLGSATKPVTSHVEAEGATNATIESFSNYGDIANNTTMAETTMTLDHHHPSAGDDAVGARLAMMPLKRSKNSSSAHDIKEIFFQSHPGEVTTVVLSFRNRRTRALKMNSHAMTLRFEQRRDADNEDEEEELCNFRVTPAHLKIAPGEEAQVLVSFTPDAGRQGIYSGALKIRSRRKVSMQCLPISGTRGPLLARV